MLQEIIKQTPEKYQPYELLAQLLDDEGRALQRASQLEAAKAQFAKAAANYEQSLLINPTHGQTYLRLGELLLGSLRESERAEKLMLEARLRFPQAPQFTYLLALARREAKHSQQAVITFEEALQEAETSTPEMVDARFFFDYGVAADQAGFWTRRPICSADRSLSIPLAARMPAITSATCGLSITCISMRPRR